MSGQMIDFKGNGQTFQGYFARGANEAPGILVIQEWWGLVDHIKDVCDRFAKEGFSALAPDLYHGEKTTSPDEAGRMFMALNIAEAEKVLQGAIDCLLSDPSCSSASAGVIGFCMGGQLSLYAACKNPDRISACVDFYGVHPNVHPPLENLKAPVLGIFAEKDASVNPQVVGKLDAQLKKLGKNYEFHTYQGRNHAFFNDTNKANYNQQDAADAWRKTLQFFRKHVA